jgi:hypothetical protein
MHLNCSLRRKDAAAAVSRQLFRLNFILQNEQDLLGYKGDEGMYEVLAVTGIPLLKLSSHLHALILKAKKPKCII